MLGAGGALTGRIGFRTAPEAGPVRFLAFGDSGNGSDDQRTLFEQMRTVPFDFMLHVGDIAYESGKTAEFEEKHFGVYAHLLRHAPMFAVPGNHEYETDAVRPFVEVFDLPGEKRRYSFDWGGVHFVGLDTERVDANAASWLDEDLAASGAAWKVAFLHKPPFSCGEHGSNADARETFSPIFERHGVDLVLAGHDHHYERMKPQGGVAYVVTGAGGSTRDVDESDFTAFAEPVMHFVYVTIDGGELLLHAIDATGQEFDQPYLAK